jgi:hypothetical protein
MDHYQNVVIEYLRADRALFVNTECCIQVNPGKNPDTSGPHWYCDAVAVNFRESAIYLCEISYSVTLESLLKRLQAWRDNWDGVLTALRRDCFLPEGWPVAPWAFVPRDGFTVLDNGIAQMAKSGPTRFEIKRTPLEDAQPWRYRSWDRIANNGADAR